MNSIKSLLKSTVPASLRRKFRETAGVASWYSQWFAARSLIFLNQRKAHSYLPGTFLIVPSDLGEIVGSRGDDAMVSTAIGEAIKRNKACQIGILTTRKELPESICIDGVTAETITPVSGIWAYFRILRKYHSVGFIGADILDGHYSVVEALRAWVFADIAARAGRLSFVIGSSFSSHPDARLRPVLSRLSAALTVNVRDLTSLKAFQREGGKGGRLVSDSAFLLSPAPTGRDQAFVDEWCAAQRNDGKLVMGFNIHPMVFLDLDPAKVAALITSTVEALGELSKRYEVALLLVPHDFRDSNRGDLAALDPLFDALSEIPGLSAAIVRAPARAGELKSIVDRVDVLVTGRMHLGVAALSMGVPVWAISPQDKFAGLFEHFGLSDQRLVPDDALDAQVLSDFLFSVASSWESTRDKVRTALPYVKELAAKNFESLDRLVSIGQADA
ncbi:polysaccharide pyruvyl transferase family protein [Phenylobacterium sp.]|uniref:polysaccharide pyruvyl transferase family protein n=1 Tax=Phenylobacterium sp. TaxID=1871053 RepID=UPI002732DC7D|nr:polysaccharide pyruvyl transferase family protein [Phenylobacterium sp.]MDP3632757.1 polysaccharide pyruvyl transferase family protein [Phenylobacterium sp.]